MKITKRQLRRIIKEERGNYPMSQYSDIEPGEDAPRRRPELQAILDAANAAHGVVPYRVLKNFFWELNSSYATDRKIMEGMHSMSPAGKALANSIKGKFMRMYPDAKVGIDGRGGFITVNGVKAIDMSQATGRAMSDEEMIDKMHVVYAETQIDADIPTSSSRMDTFREGKMKITKKQLRRIIREAMSPVGDAGDEVLRKAMDIFGSGALVDEQGGEIVIDTGVTDTDIEELYSAWISAFPDAVHEEGGLIYTGVPA